MTREAPTFLLAIACGLVIGLIVATAFFTPTCKPGSVADRTAAGMSQMFDGSPWNRMAADEVTW